MAEFAGYDPGMFCWIDTATTDAEASKTFYAGLFGWEAADQATPDGGVYTMYGKGGKPVAGGGTLADELVAMGVASHWMSYVAVDDVAAALAKVAAAGGTPMGPPIPIGESGVMGVFSDPTGATCSLWQAGAHYGAALANEDGTLIWNELVTNDVEAAAAFYTEVFGWGRQVHDMPNGPYHVFTDGERARAGMMAITAEMGEMPPSWSVYFAVDDIDAAAARVGELGGRVEGGIMEAPGVGRFAVAADPTGAYFMLMESAPPA